MNTSSRALIAITAATLLTMAAVPAASAASGTSGAARPVAASDELDAGSGRAVQAAAGPPAWGPYYSPGAKRAKTLGTIVATGEDHEVIPSAATLTVSGTISDLTRASSTCGWAVFNIATVNPAGNKVTWKRHHARTCAYSKPRTFSFTNHRVYQVELKVCAERRASEPSIQCTAGNPAWKTIYLSPR
ncbi:hypothetical protein ACIBQX_04125 [Nonomuraea sp. NPDC049714]|uniref:hypothetical protein n=1 Tax=Nonomuraea sp. NPDC049714 TaxID=3364357 RepID=UPI00379E221F